MANSFPPSVNAVQVGSFFVQQYYHVLQQQPEFVHQFYTDASTMIRVDGESTETASALFQIHTLVQSLSFSAIEIKTINSLDSCTGGVLVVVSGSVKSKYFIGWRKFVQTFFLAPQDKGYFVLNDIFHFVSEEVIHHYPVPVVPEAKGDSQPTISSPPLESTGHDPEDASEVEARESFNSIHLADDPEDYYNPLEQPQEDDPVSDSVEEEVPVEEASPPLQNALDFVQEPEPVAEDSVGEPVKLSYASILRAPKGKSVLSVVAQQPSFSKSTAAVSDWHLAPEPVVHPSVSVPSFTHDSIVDVAEEEGSTLEEEGELKSVYVRHLPPSVSTVDIFQEFKNFGRIKHDGVFLKNRKDVGVCFAFVEFEDLDSVRKAIEASPIQLAGRQVYIEERRPNSNSTFRGGRRGGRGRGSYQHDSGRGRFGPGTYGRGNGFRAY